MDTDFFDPNGVNLKRAFQQPWLQPPATMKSTPHLAFRWAATTLCAILLGAGTAGVCFYEAFQLGRFDTFLVPSLITSALFFITPWIMHYFRSVEVGASIICFVPLLFGLPAVSIQHGGLFAPAILWLSVYPILASFLLGARGAFVATGIIGAETAVVLFMRVYGYDFLNGPVRADFLVDFLVSVSLSSLVVAIIAWLFARERNRTLIELHESQERYALAAKGMSYGLWEVNLISKDIYVSERCREILGYAAHDIFDARHFFESSASPQEKEKLRAKIKSLIDGVHPMDAQLQIHNKLGELRWLRLVAEIEFTPEGAPSSHCGLSQ